MSLFISLVTIPEFGCQENIAAIQATFTYCRTDSNLIAINFGGINQTVATSNRLQYSFADMKYNLPGSITKLWHTGTGVELNLPYASHTLIVTQPASLSLFSYFCSGCGFCTGVGP